MNINKKRLINVNTHVLTNIGATATLNFLHPGGMEMAMNKGVKLDLFTANQYNIIEQIF